MGIQVSPVSDSLALVNKLPSTQGGRIMRVFPNTTAATLKLKLNDIILEFNDTPIKEFTDVPAKAREFKTGQYIKLKVARQGKIITVKGKVQPMPFETSINAYVEYGEVALVNNGYARSIMKKPKGQGKFPAIFFIQGYSCASLDNLPEKDSQRQLIDGLVARGYSVLLMEKPGTGDTKGTKPCSEIGYIEEKDAFAAGLKQLKKYEFVDTVNIFLFGHSLGANTAPLIAADNKVKGIISYGVAGKPWLEYLIDLSREQRTIVGGDYIEADERMRITIPFLYELLVLKKTPQELEKMPLLKSLWRKALGMIAKIISRLRFTRFYSTSRCCPTREALLTGLYNHQAGIGEMTTNRNAPGYRGYLIENTLTLAEVLKASGYHTAMAGKWHVSDTLEQATKEGQRRWLNQQDHHPFFSPIEQYPTKQGFKKYYGNIFGVVNFFDPF